MSKNPPKKGSVIRTIAVFFAVFIGLGLAAGGVGIGAFAYLSNAPEEAPVTLDDSLRVEAGGRVFLEVRQGESAYSVGARLEAAGLIRSHYVWDILARFDDAYIKAGDYRFAYPAGQQEIRDILVAGQLQLIRVTVPEGVTLKKTARIVAEAGICAEEDFLAAAMDPAIRDEYRVPGFTMEGYLYPDTYFFQAGYPADQVVRFMADTFFQRLAEIPGDPLDIPPEELFRRVIIASIVEREYRAADEAPLMAGVFYNRLDIGMALQSCATVEYVITEIQGKPHPATIYDRDTRIDDPYNTYVYAGLPPGPISAPGLVALDAVFNPVASDYRYFRLVNPDEGRHYFAKTFDEHIQAAALYTKGN
ncbi:MAG: endolytic transglycosylase MltG [Treponema sp.]|nr:endolytic transglycosylase MltG [Treponema sp.]